MGLISFPPPVKAICAILHSESLSPDAIRAALESMLGAIDLTSDAYPFVFTEYYNSRMILPLRKFFVSFSRLVERESLPEIKRSTNRLEDALLIEMSGKKLRSANLDPGYIARSKLVLASTKNFSHRIYLRDGIFGEVTLTYTKGKFNPNPWTFLDYRTDIALSFFQRVRDRYMDQLRQQAFPLSGRKG